MPGAEELQFKEISLCSSAQSFRYQTSFRGLPVIVASLLPSAVNATAGVTFNRQPHFKIPRQLNQMDQCKGNILNLPKKMHRRDAYLGKNYSRSPHFVMTGGEDQKAVS